jgi:hypothetical protein
MKLVLPLSPTCPEVQPNAHQSWVLVELQGNVCSRDHDDMQSLRLGRIVDRGEVGSFSEAYGSQSRSSSPQSRSCTSGFRLQHTLSLSLIHLLIFSLAHSLTLTLHVHNIRTHMHAPTHHMHSNISHTYVFAHTHTHTHTHTHSLSALSFLSVSREKQSC